MNNEIQEAVLVKIPNLEGPLIEEMLKVPIGSENIDEIP